jgi:hypothetical protein
MNSSELSEKAWDRAASILKSDIDNRICEVQKDSEDYSILKHIENVIIPSLRRRAQIVKRNRREY